jgi:hypothetical protein
MTTRVASMRPTRSAQVCTAKVSIGIQPTPRHNQRILALAEDRRRSHSVI